MRRNILQNHFEELRRDDITITCIIVKIKSMQRSWAITKSQILDTNVEKLFIVENPEECNVRVLGIRFQRYFHLVDKMQVWTACLVLNNDRMWRRTESGKSLNLSSFSFSQCFAFFIFLRKSYMSIVSTLLNIEIEQKKWNYILQ